MDFLISSTIRQLPRSPPTQVQSTWSKTFTTRAEASPSRGRRQIGEVPCWRAPLQLLGTVPDVCGDCNPPRYAFGVWNDLGMFGVFVIQSRWHNICEECISGSMRYITSSYMATAFGSRPPWSSLHGTCGDFTASPDIRALWP